MCTSSRKQRGSNSKFHPYAKRGFIVGHDRESSAWHVWLSAQEKMVTSAHVTFSPEPDALDFLENTAVIHVSDDPAHSGEQQPKPVSEDVRASVQQASNVEQCLTETIRANWYHSTASRPSKLVETNSKVSHTAGPT